MQFTVPLVPGLKKNAVLWHPSSQEKQLLLEGITFPIVMLSTAWDLFLAWINLRIKFWQIAIAMH